MTGGQIVALIFAILLLLPGGCFLFFGVSLGNVSGLISIGIGIFAIAGCLFWVAFRKRTNSGEPPR